MDSPLFILRVDDFHHSVEFPRELQHVFTIPNAGIKKLTDRSRKKHAILKLKQNRTVSVKAMHFKKPMA